MGRQKTIGFWYFAAVLIATGIYLKQAQAVEIPPTPTSHYYGDADGNVSLNLSDIAQHNTYTSFKPCAYDTLQPQTGGQYWNTCDVDGNRSCNLSDIAILNSYMSFKPVSLGGDPWVLENVNLPLSGNETDTWIPFNINLYMTYSGAPSGRPGISVVAEIDPTSPGHGQLSGRSCTPVGGTRDQLAPADAQCALAVTITDWQAGQEGLGLTESGPYGFQVWGDGDGDLQINFHVEANSAMDIPEVILDLIVSFDPQCNDGLDNDGDTFIDYPEDIGCSDINDTYEGNHWSQVGPGPESGSGLSDINGFPWFPIIALDPSGNPVVVWTDNGSGNYDVYIKRWDGSSWVEIGSGSASGGGISNCSGDSYNSDLSIDSFGNPFVAWVEVISGNADVYIKKWDGISWVEIGEGSASGGGISNSSSFTMNSSLALYPNGYPVVAWCEDFDLDHRCDEIYIKRWDGNDWVEIGAGSASGGGISNSIGNSRDPSLAMDPSGNPMVAWADNTSGNYEIYIRRWDGISWVEVGEGSASGGGISNNMGSSIFVYLAIDSSGKPVIAWQDESSGNYEIYIKRWDGVSWVEVGEGSASGGGVSNNGVWAQIPSLALDPSGNPVVTWHDTVDYYQNVFIKYYNRSGDEMWGEIGEGSSTGLGISNTYSGACCGSLSIDADGNPFVAWEGGTYGGIFVKRWIP